MKKVLIVTYYWPPGSNPGVLRMLKFSKYLPEFGWQPVVLTVSKGSYPAIDNSLEGKISSDVKVHKTTSLEPFRLYNFISGKKGNSGTVGMANIKDSKSLIQKFSLFVRANFFIPDARVGWVPYAYKRAAQLVKDEKIDVVLTTGPPQSTHLVGLQLKRKLGVPWVMDLRDPWTGIYYNKFLPRTQRAKNKDKALEVESASAADYITTVSKGLEEEFRVLNKNIELIYNGFDEDDFNFGNVEKLKNRFRICFFGNLLPNQDIPGLWKGIQRAAEHSTDLRTQLELTFIGNVHDEILSRLRKILRSECVVKMPYMPHGDAVRMMREAHVLLFIIPDSEDNELILTGKLFEYLASGSFILPVGPINGNAAEVLEKTGRGKMLAYDDVEGIKREVLRLFERGNAKMNSQNNSLDQATLFYSRRNQTKRLSKVLDEVMTRIGN